MTGGVDAINVYGIPNCDTVRRARAWLADRGACVVWHDFKKQGVPEAELGLWLREVGWERLLNRQGTTWRKLEPAAQADIADATSARRLMLEQPSIIKRPVVCWPDGAVTVGFDEAMFGQRMLG